MSKKPSGSLSNADEERIKRLVADFEARLRKSFSEPTGTLDDIETDAGVIGDAVKEGVTKEKIDKVASAPHES